MAHSGFYREVLSLLFMTGSKDLLPLWCSEGQFTVHKYRTSTEYARCKTAFFKHVNPCKGQKTIFFGNADVTPLNESPKSAT